MVLMEGDVAPLCWMKIKMAPLSKVSNVDKVEVQNVIASLDYLFTMVREACTRLILSKSSLFCPSMESFNRPNDSCMYLIGF